jgi:hypothetical protein
MYLGTDKEGENLFYLTNKKFANPANPTTDPIEARLSSPPIVKMISIEQLKELKYL